MTKTRESQEQANLMDWADWSSGRHPELELLYHIPNGGCRDRAEAARLKAEGVKAGVPDLCLPVARGGKHGLYIELKVEGNRPTQRQREWLERLREQGYAAVVCYGFDEARRAIEEYLG